MVGKTKRAAASNIDESPTKKNKTQGSDGGSPLADTQTSEETLDDKSANINTTEVVDDGAGTEVIEETSKEVEKVVTLDVKKKIVKPVFINIAKVTLEEYGDRLVERIHAFNNYDNPASNTYAIGRIPSAREWGVKRGSWDDKSAYVCKPSFNEPYVLWITAHVSRSWFVEGNGKNPNQVSLSLVPLSDPSGYSGRALLALLSKPVESSAVDGWADLRTSRWMNTAAESKSGKAAPAFANCYDARSVFRAKNDMSHYPAAELAAKDLVIVEVNVCRYRVYDSKLTAEELKARVRSQSWDNWRAFYDLRSVSLLSKAAIEDKMPDADMNCAILI